MGVLTAAGSALTGCGGEEDTGTEVEDVTGAEVADSSPAAQGEDAVATGEDTGMASAAADPYRGAYKRKFNDDRNVYEGGPNLRATKSPRRCHRNRREPIRYSRVDR